MKCWELELKDERANVAPLVGAWIEMLVRYYMYGVSSVAPLVGAWIEILSDAINLFTQIVAPLVGAWIEMAVQYVKKLCFSSLLL